MAELNESPKEPQESLIPTNPDPDLQVKNNSENQTLQESKNPKNTQKNLKFTSNQTKKKHFIDDLDFEFKKRTKINFVTTPPGKSSNKDFVKRNIQRSNILLPNKNPLPTEQVLESLIEEGGKRKNLDIKERFYDKAETYKKKKEELKEKFFKDELSGCTFQPKTNSKEKEKPKQSTLNAKLEDYLQKQKKKLEKAQEDAKKAAEKEENSEDLSYKPKICEKSKEILSKKPQNDTPIHERLYNHSKNHPKPNLEEEGLNECGEEVEALVFHPTINKKSQNLARSGRIEAILYEDAVRRQKNPPKQATSPTPKFLNSNSEKVLIERFKRDFFDCLEQNSSTESLDYLKTLELFKMMHFVREDKEEVDLNSVLNIWRLFNDSEESHVDVEQLLAAFLAIMGFFEDWMANETLLVKFSRAEVKKFHLKYEQLYKNRSIVTLKSNVNQSFKNVVEHSFQPERIAQSDELAQKWRNSHREPGKIELALFAEKAGRDKRLNELKKQVDFEIMKECSFKPKTEELPGIYFKNEKVDGVGKNAHKGLALYDLASKKNQKEKQKTSEELQLEKDLQECTFKPSILDRSSISSTFFQRSLDSEKSTSPKTSKKSQSPPKSDPESHPRLDSFRIFENPELGTIKETLEDELSPKITFEKEQCDLENFEKLENMIFEENSGK